MNKSKETIEDILKDAAENGDTQKLLGLLEKGAPFVVDMVDKYLIINILRFKHFYVLTIYTQSIFIQIILKHKHLTLYTYNFSLFHLGPVKNKVWNVTKKIK